jgi:hypothetical protein
MAPELFAYWEYYTPPVKASLLANLQFDAPGVADLFGRVFSPGLGCRSSRAPRRRATRDYIMELNTSPNTW